MAETVYTIGHSTHRIEHFISLLEMHGITAISDVRSHPYSHVAPQFDRERLKTSLHAAGIAYVFLGDNLGARTTDEFCYANGRVQYARLASTASFSDGLKRIVMGTKAYRVALMCAEKEPLECHRTILIARHLEAQNIPVNHILTDGKLETHTTALYRLMDMLGVPDNDIFRSPDQLIADAYAQQEERIAYHPANRANRWSGIDHGGRR